MADIITFDRGLAIAGFILTILLIVLDKAGKLRGPVLFCLLAIAAAMTLPLVFSIPWVAGRAGPELFARRALMACLVGVAYSLLCVWIAGDMNSPTEEGKNGSSSGLPWTPQVPPVKPPEITKQEVPSKSPASKNKGPSSPIVEGHDNTEVGVGPLPSIKGNGNTIVGATDAHGNTIFNQPNTAIGNGAQADGGGIAIGAGAHAGGDQQHCESGSICNQNSPNLGTQQVNNYGPPARRLGAQQKTDFSACLTTYPGEIEIGALMGSPEAYAFASDWVDVFRAAKWTIQDNLIRTFLIGGGIWSGTQISVRGSINPDGSNAKFKSDSAEGAFVSCLTNKPFPGGAVVIPKADAPENKVILLVGPPTPQ